MSRDQAFGVAYSTTPKIQIAPSCIPSLTGQEVGDGVFVSPGQVVQQGQIISEYGGEARWATTREVQQVAIHSRYAFCFGPFRVRPNATAKPTRHRYFCVLDAQDTERNNILCCGHVVNTCTPKLPGCYNQSNCIFGVDVSQLRLQLDIQPVVRVYIVAGQTIRGGLTLSESSEVTVDYHWELAYSSGLWCENPDCYNCVEGLYKWSKARLEYLRSNMDT